MLVASRRLTQWPATDSSNESTVTAIDLVDSLVKQNLAYWPLPGILVKPRKLTEALGGAGDPVSAADSRPIPPARMTTSSPAQPSPATIRMSLCRFIWSSDGQFAAGTAVQQRQ